MQWPFTGDIVGGHCFCRRGERWPGKFAGGTPLLHPGAENERKTSAERAQNVRESSRVSFRVPDVPLFRVPCARVPWRFIVGVCARCAVPRSPCRSAVARAAAAVCR